MLRAATSQRLAVRFLAVVPQNTARVTAPVNGGSTFSATIACGPEALGPTEVLNMFLSQKRVLLPASPLTAEVSFSNFSKFFHWYKANRERPALKDIEHLYSTYRVDAKRMEAQGGKVVPSTDPETIIYLLQRRPETFGAVAEFVCANSKAYRPAWLVRIVEQAIYSAQQQSRSPTLVSVLGRVLLAVREVHPEILSEISPSLVQSLIRMTVGVGEDPTALIRGLEAQGYALDAKIQEECLEWLDTSAPDQVLTGGALGITTLRVTPLSVNHFLPLVSTFPELCLLLNTIDRCSEPAAVYHACQEAMVEALVATEAGDASPMVMAARLAGLGHRIQGHAALSRDLKVVLLQWIAFYGGSASFLKGVELSEGEMQAMTEAAETGRKAWAP